MKNKSIKYIYLDEKEWKHVMKSNQLSSPSIKNFVNNNITY